MLYYIRYRFICQSTINKSVVRGSGIPNYSNAGKGHQQMYLQYYVYAYLRQIDNTPCYIGKGKGNRAWKGKHNVSIPKDKSKIILIEQCLTNIGACAIERRLIKWYGRKDLGTGILYNRTDGGEGAAGRILSKNQKKTISQFHLGKAKSHASRPGILNTFYGKTHSTDSKLKQSLQKQGSNNPMFGQKQTRLSCLHCKKEISINSFTRFHSHT